MHQKDTSANLAIGIVAGLALGAGVALLFAPKTGASMREDLGESVGTLRAAVGRRLRDLADRAGVEVADIGFSVDRATEAVESTAREMVKVAAQGIRSATT